jgi:hypothetical protein
MGPELMALGTNKLMELANIMKRTNMQDKIIPRSMTSLISHTE